MVDGAECISEVEVDYDMYELVVIVSESNFYTYGRSNAAVIYEYNLFSQKCLAVEIQQTRIENP